MSSTRQKTVRNPIESPPRQDGENPASYWCLSGNRAAEEFMAVERSHFRLEVFRPPSWSSAPGILDYTEDEPRRARGINRFIPRASVD